MIGCMLTTTNRTNPKYKYSIASTFAIIIATMILTYNNLTMYLSAKSHKFLEANLDIVNTLMQLDDIVPPFKSLSYHSPD